MSIYIFCLHHPPSHPPLPTVFPLTLASLMDGGVDLQGSGVPDPGNSPAAAGSGMARGSVRANNTWRPDGGYALSAGGVAILSRGAAPPVRRLHDHRAR